jgi:signal transduction histidine kinase
MTPTRNLAPLGAGEHDLYAPRSSLMRRLALSLMSIGLLSATIAAGALWGMQRLHADHRVAGASFDQLRSVYEVGSLIESAGSAGLSLPERRDRLRRAQLRLEEHRHRFDPDAQSAVQRLSDDLEHAIGGQATSDRWLMDVRAQLASLAGSAQARVKAIDAATQSTRDRTIAMTATASGVLLVLVGWIGARLYRSIREPLARLSQAADELGAGDLSRRAPRERDAELDRLAGSFNAMADRLTDAQETLERRVAERGQQLAAASRLASVGYLAAGVVHEISNPLAIIAGYGQRAARAIERDDDPRLIRESLSVIAEEVARTQRLTSRLLSLAKPTLPTADSACLGDAVRFAADAAGALPDAARVSIRCRIDSPIRVRIDADQLRQLALNLLINAITATRGTSAPAIDITVRARDGWAVLTCEDNGCGIAAEHLDTVFEPFVSTRGEGGTGLGLSIVRAIVEGAGGSVVATSEGIGRGSRFEVRVPLRGTS